MKKMTMLCLACIMGLILAACCCGNEPKDAVKNYLTAVQKGDYKSALDYVFFSSDKEEAQAQKEQFQALLEEKAKDSGDEQPKVKSFEILNQEIDKEAGTATVSVSVTDNNGNTREQTIDLMKDDDGKWLLQNPK